LVHAEAARAADEFARLKAAAMLAAEKSIECHAGHGLDYVTAHEIARLPQVVELNIGHFLIAEAIFIGLEAAILKMRAAMETGRAASLS
jgi:pyridoxine 5-phosphate synthase